MKKRNSQPPTGHFWQSQSEQAQSTISHKEKHFNQYDICRPFPRQIKSSFMYSIVGINFAFLVSVASTFLLLVDPNGQAGSIITALVSVINSQLWLSLISFSLIIKAVIIITLLLDWRIPTDPKMHKLLLKFTQFVLEYLRILIQLDFHSSSLLLITGTLPSLLNFIVSVIIIGFSIIFLQNYSSRRDDFFVGSVNFYLLLRMKITIGSAANFACLYIDQTQIAKYCFLTVHATLAVIIVTAYLSQGFIIYRATLLKWGVFLQTTSYLSLAINMLFSEFVSINFTMLMVNSFLTTLVFANFIYQTIANKKTRIVMTQASLELEIFELLELLQESHRSDEISSLLNGCLALHNVNQCSNPHCFTHSESLYDSKARTYCSIKNIHNDRISLVKFYLKCKFESFLQVEPKNFDAMLSYAEFLYHQFDNTGLSLYWVTQVSQNRTHLSFNAMLKFNGLLRKIRDDNSVFCRTLYGSKYVIEELIEAEQTNLTITKNTFQILHEKIDIWKLLQGQEIDISLLRSKTESVMRKIDTSNQLWMGISHYVQMSRHWKFQYLCFAIFFKNERVKNKVLEDFDSTTRQKEKIFEIEGSSSVSVDLFDINSCCIHTQLRQQGMFIKRVSRYFPKLTNYSIQEMQNSNIKVLMPKLIASKHEQMLRKYSKEGKLSNQEYYNIKQVHIVNKKGYIVPVVKMYKEFVNLQGQLQYVCFLKRINEQECMFLCDQNFEITGLTQRCKQMITDEIDDDAFLTNVNLLSLIPELAKYTKFQPFVGGVREELPDVSVQNSLTQLLMERSSGSVRQTSYIPSQPNGMVAPNTSISSIKSTVSFKLIYPESSLKDYTYAYQTYQNKHGKYSLENYYQCINAISNKIQQNYHNIYNCCIAIHQVNNTHGMRYYQVKLTKIRANKPINSMILIPRGKEDTCKGNEFVTMSEMPRESNKTEEGDTKVPTNLNIFLKEDVNLAPKSNLRLKYIKNIWFIYLLLATFILFLNMTLLQTQFLKMITSVRSIESTGRVSIISSRLINIYICKLLSIPSNIAQIPTLTLSIQQRMSSPSMRSAFFDPQINVPQIYYPIDNKTAGYNQIDFLYFMESVLRTLAANTNKQNKYLYKLLMSYQFPAYNDYINQTNINLDIAFNTSEEIINTQYLFIFLLQSLILLITIILIAVLSYRFYFSMIEMVKIHCHFSEKDIVKIIRYSQGIISIFSNLLHMEMKIGHDQDLVGGCSRLLKQHSSSKEEPQEKCNLNKRTKKVRIGKRITRERIVYFVKIMACFAIFLALTVGRNQYLHSLVAPIVYQEVIGQNYLNLIPTKYLTAQIVAWAYNPNSHPTFNPTQYQSLLSNLNIIMNSPYIGSTTSDAVSILIKQLFYSDACMIINQNVLKANNITLDECRSIANYSFKNGFRQYSKYQLDMSQRILNNGYTPTLSEVKEYFRSVDIYHILNKYIIDTWIAQCNILTDSSNSSVQFTTISNFFLLLLVIIFFRLHILTYLQRQYSFYRFFYNNMMPEYIISFQKIIRSNLSVINFL